MKRLHVFSQNSKPSAFDIYSDTLCLSTPGCFSFYHLSNLSVPKHVIHYEQSKADKLCFQKQGGNLLAALRTGVVSFWDPGNSLSPLVGSVNSPGAITDMDWSANSNLLSTVCSAGSVRIWDARSPSLAVQQMSLGGLHNCNQVDWCPTNNHLLSVVAENRIVLIFDNRMYGRLNHKKEDDSVNIFEPSGGITCSSWCENSLVPVSKTAKQMSICSIVVGTGKNTIEYWDVHQENQTRSLQSALQVSNSREVAMRNTNTLLATSSDKGSGVVLLQSLLQDDSKSGKNSTNNNNNADEHQYQYNLTLFPSSPGFLHTSTGTGTGMSLQDSELQNRVQHAQVDIAKIECSSILGMKWGPGSFITKAGTNDMELIIITDKAELIAVRVPNDFSSMSKDYQNHKNAAESSSSQAPLVAAISTEHKKILTNEKTNLFNGRKLQTVPRYSSNLLRKSAAVSSSTSTSMGGESKNKNNGSDSSQSLLLSEKDKTGTGIGMDLKSNAIQFGSSIFWSGIETEILKLEDMIQQGMLEGLSIGAIDQYARQVTLTLTGNAKQHGSLKSMSAPTPTRDSDSLHRTMSLIVRFPSRNLPSFALRGLDGSIQSSIGAVLISELDSIVESFSKLFTHSQSQDPSVSATSVSSSLKNDGLLLYVSKCFRNRCLQFVLLDQTDQFLQLQSSNENKTEKGEKSDKADTEGEEGDPNSNPNSPKESESNASISPMGSSHNSHNNQNQNQNFVDPMAYRVPCPASSGARWSAHGQLLCFGGACLNLAKISNSTPSANTNANANATTTTTNNNNNNNDQEIIDQVNQINQNNPGLDNKSNEVEIVYPKSLGDMLIMERAQEEFKRDRIQIHTQGGQGTDLDREKSNYPYQSDSDNSTSSGNSDVYAQKYNGNGNDDRNHTSTKYLDNHVLPLAYAGDAGQTLESLGEDLDLLAYSNAQYSGGSSRNLRNKQIAKNMNMQILETSSQLTIFQPLSKIPYKFADQFSLGPILGSLNHNLVGVGEDNNNNNINSTNELLVVSDETKETKDSGDNTGNNNRNDLQTFETPASLKLRIAACNHNCELVSSESEYYPDSITQVWALMAMALDLYSISLENCVVDKEGSTMLNWNDSVIGSRLLKRLVLTFVDAHDLQLLATCICVLGGSKETIKLIDIQDKDDINMNMIGNNNNNNNSNNQGKNNKETAGQAGRWGNGKNMNMNNLKKLFDRALISYSQVLSRWGLLHRALEVKKHIPQHDVSENEDGDRILQEENPSILCSAGSCFRCGTIENLCVDDSQNSQNTNTTTNNTINTNTNGNDDKTDGKIWWCQECNDRSTYCSVCHLSVKGTGFFCIGCGHGGHAHHIKSWLQSSVECATGCGCRCAELAISQRISSFPKAFSNDIRTYASSSDETGSSESESTGSDRSVSDDSSDYDDEDDESGRLV